MHIYYVRIVLTILVKYHESIIHGFVSLRNQLKGKMSEKEVKRILKEQIGWCVNFLDEFSSFVLYFHIIS